MEKLIFYEFLSSFEDIFRYNTAPKYFFCLVFKILVIRLSKTSLSFKTVSIIKTMIVLTVFFGPENKKNIRYVLKWNLRDLSMMTDVKSGKNFQESTNQKSEVIISWLSFWMILLFIENLASWNRTKTNNRLIRWPFAIPNLESLKKSRRRLVK